MNDDPTIGIAADPDDRRVPEAHLRQLVADLVRQRPRARDEPDVPRGEDLRRDDPDVRLSGRERARAVRPEHPDALGADVGVDAEHLVRRDALGDRDHRVDARVDRLVDRVGGERRRARRPSTCWRRARGRRRRRCRARGRPRRPGRPCRASPLRRGSSRRRGSAARGSAPRSPSAPGRRAACPCRRRSPRQSPLTARIAILSSVSRPSATRSPRSASTRSASSPSQPVRASQAAKSNVCSKKRTSSSGETRLLDERAPLGLGVVADVRRVAQRLGLLDVVAHEAACRRSARGRG